MLRIARDKFRFKAASMNFMRRVSRKNGLGPHVCIPPNLKEGKYSVDDARSEAQLVMFKTVSEVLEKTGIRPDQIDVVVTNCSIFNPIPSLSAMLVNKFKMRDDVRTFSLGGMGCSAGQIGLDIIREILTNGGNCKYGLLVSTENMTQNFYIGLNRSMILPNTIFRLGCSAVLFQNVPRKAKYLVKELIRTHTGADDGAYSCVYETTDEQGLQGVALAKSITSNAMKALTINMKKVFVSVLPVHLMLDYVLRLAKLYGKYYWDTRVKHISTTYPMPVMPKISHKINNFCFHTGGRAVIDGMQSMFNLSDEQIEASRAALYRYGNTSSASTWYELAYHESTGSVHRGNLVWQIAFGSGFKCNSTILKALRTITSEDATQFDPLDREWRYKPEMLLKDPFTKEEENMDYDAWESEMLQAEREAQEEEYRKRYSGLEINVRQEKNINE